MLKTQNITNFFHIFCEKKENLNKYITFSVNKKIIVSRETLKSVKN